MEDYHQDDRKKEMGSNGRLCIKLKIHKWEEEAAADHHDDHQVSPGEESLLSLIAPAAGGVKDQHQNTNTHTPGSDEIIEGGSAAKEVRRVCGICNKGFSSGKALGGHMRVHVQATHRKASGGGGGGGVNAGALLMKPQFQRQYVNSSSSAGGMTIPVCSLCGKTFSSMKSLFGHMRCHPERDWRGIQPPVLPTPIRPPHPPNENSSSSTLSDAIGRRNIDLGEQIDSTNTTNAVAAAAAVDAEAEAMPPHPNPNNRPVAFDLARRFRGWSRTDKRGRKIYGTSSGSSDPSESTGGAAAVSASSWSGAAGSGSGSEEHIPDAVYNLMLLAQGRPFSSYQHQEYDSMGGRNAAGNNNSKYDNNKRRSSMEEDEERQQVMRSDDPQENDDNEDLLEVKGTKKGQSQVLLLGTPDHLDQQQHEHHGCRRSKMKHPKSKQEGEEEDRSRRSVEEDGGGHEKKTMVNSKNKARSEEAGLITLKQKKHRKRMKLRDLDTVLVEDGGEVPVDEKYKCSTCNKSFSTHQALGGHRSSHNKLKNQHHHHRPQVPPLPSKELVTGEQAAAAVMEVKASGFGGVGKVLLGFDLNELPEEGSGMDLDEYWGGGVCEPAGDGHAGSFPSLTK